ncbi:hypothetical protein HN587_00970 [Candidatus Woesearchaeota archaeon]|jgi:hypothetical protein|nr:hypothetical protein [Candidatus Woesearchaeota archaeon]
MKLNKLLVIFGFLFILLVSSINGESNCGIVVYEGDLVQLDPEAQDPDSDIGPAGELIWEFGSPFDSAGIWQTKKGQRGIFDFWVSVTDGEFTDVRNACVEVLNNNQNPIIEYVDSVKMIRGQSKTLNSYCYDPDGDIVSVSYAVNGREINSLNYEPPGLYYVDVICEDGFGGVDTARTTVEVLMPEIMKSQQEIKKSISSPVDQSIVVYQSSVESENLSIKINEIKSDIDLVVLEKSGVKVIISEDAFWNTIESDETAKTIILENNFENDLASDCETKTKNNLTRTCYCAKYGK